MSRIPCRTIDDQQFASTKSKNKSRHFGLSHSGTFFYFQLIEKLGSGAPRSKEIERMLPILAQFISDANSDVRINTKKAFLKLYKEMLTRKEFENLLQKSLTEQQFQKVTSCLNKELQEEEFVLTNTN